LIVSLILSPAAVPLWWGLLQGAMIQAIEGIAWCIVALGVSPYLERLFDLLTPTRLAELSNLNRPLLRRLAAEAPGTFQHTLFVATLAEAAAYALGCNAELVRAGTLYHDIGKLHDPQGFIENQMGEINKHDLIDNPWKSAALIKKHVSEGVIMARRASLPKLVQAFVPEHQGTMDITYFRHKAQQLHQSDPDRYPLIDAEFRYDGPAPQSRETGLVMLADSCEAALRSLKDASVEDALGMVNKILRARWQDQQLASSGLSRSDLDIIASVFVQIWQQHHHKRIAYPASRPLPGSPYPAPSYPSSPYPNTGYKP
jgi:cyclic-di-AMP phosphodiesterase PgpH